MDIKRMIWGLFISLVGFAYYRYGKKMQLTLPILVGVSLMLAPYFMTNLLVLIGVSAALMLFPFIIKK